MGIPLFAHIELHSMQEGERESSVRGLSVRSYPPKAAMPALCTSEEVAMRVAGYVMMAVMGNLKKLMVQHHKLSI